MIKYNLDIKVLVAESPSMPFARYTQKMNMLRFTLVTAAIGILLGVFTSFGQTFIPDPFRQLANSYSVWLFFSFIAGYILVSYKQALISGALLQYLAILFYYAASSIRFDMDYSIESLISLNLVWIIGGTLAGPAAGLAGALMKEKKYVPYAIGFMAGLFLSEALYQFIALNYIGEGIVFVSAGLVFLTAGYHKVRFPLVKTLLSAALFTVIMYVGYAVVLGSLFS